MERRLDRSGKLVQLGSRFSAILLANYGQLLPFFLIAQFGSNYRVSNINPDRSIIHSTLTYEDARLIEQRKRRGQGL